MKRLLIIAGTLLLSQFLLAQDPTAKKVDELMTAYAKAGRFNGSALVAYHGHIVLQKGYGMKNSRDNSTNDANTRFQIASVTKSFTAAVVLKLVELGKISLNDRLSKYYKGFPYGDSITIENLLTHTSGIHNFTEEDTLIAETDERRIIPYLKTLKPDFAPGAAWHYSNSGYVMLGYIIQQVSGMSYWQAVRKYIFIPAGMNSSGFDFAHAADNKATGYDVLNDSMQKAAIITDSTVPFAAGAIYSTVSDLYKWHSALQANKIVQKQLMEKAWSPCRLNNYGYGWQIDSLFGHKMVSHSGAITGFGSNFALIPDDDICIVLLSNKSGSTGELFNITNKLVAALYHKPYTVPVKRTPVNLPEAILKRYTGTYEIADMHLIINMGIQNGGLTVEPSKDGHPGGTSKILPVDNTHFYDQRDEEVEAMFDVDATGKVKGVQILQRGISKYAAKIK